MSSLFVVRILLSFLTGGLLITGLTLAAERTRGAVSGVLLMFPTTIVVGFFFLALTTSAAQVAYIVPATLLPLGIVVFSSVIYIHCASFLSRYIRSLPLQVVCTFLVSAVVWLCIALQVAVFRINNLALGIMGYLLPALAAHLLLNRRGYAVQFQKRAYSRWQLAFRALFTGSIIALVVLSGKLLGPFWAGVFTMFPAATFATLCILHLYYQPRQLARFMRGAPIGSINLFAYCLAVMLLYPRLGLGWGTVASYAVSMVVAILLVSFRKQR